jgi:hypothetical protein
VANKTLLDAVNEILKRLSIVSGDSALLTTLTDSARQVDIDVAVQSVNEVMEELYSISALAKPNQQTSSTITLATNTRAYALQTGIVRLHWPFIDRTHNQYLWEYGPGYDSLLLLDPEQDDTGNPMFGAIRPTDGYLHLDRAPTSVQNGYIYTYQYDKDIGLTSATDQVPFNNTVFRAMVPAWVQIWKRDRRNEFDPELFKGSFGRAARLLGEQGPRTSWSPRPVQANSDFIFGD